MVSEPLTVALNALPSLASAPPADAPGVSWLETVQAGGVIGYIIIALSVVALTFMVMHFVQIRRAALLPPAQLEALGEMLSRHDVAGAIEYCLSPENDSYLTRIVVAGLTRFQQSAFGAFEVKSAIEEAGEDQTARLYRSTDAIGVIGSIAPLLGLLGTVSGMVGAFQSLPRSTGMVHQDLATNISMALVTTLLGLIVAIPCIAAYSFFRNRIDALGSEAGLEIERLVLHLESDTGTASPGRAAARAAAASSALTSTPRHYEGER